MRHLLFAAVFLSLLTRHSFAQERQVTLSEAVALALERNPTVQEAALRIEQQSALKRSALDIPKTDVSLLYGQYNSIEKNDNNITISQTIPFPTVFARQQSLNNMLVHQSELKAQLTVNDVTYQVKGIVNKLQYLKARQEMLHSQDSILDDLARVADVQYRTGEGTLLGKTIAETQQVEMKNQLFRNQADIRSTKNSLQLLIHSPDVTDVMGDLEQLAEYLDTDTVDVMNHPASRLAKQSVRIAAQQKKVESARVFPEFQFGYFTQTLIGFQNVDGQEIYYGSDKRFHGFQFGLSFPLLFAAPSARIRAAGVAVQIASKQEAAVNLLIEQQYAQASQELNKNKNSVEYLRASALVTANMISEQTKKSFESGELDYATLLSNLRQALSVREQYLLALYQYNNSIIELQYLNGNK